MAITQNTFTGNGSNLGPFTFTFKWLESTDVKVTVNGVLKTAGTHYNLQALNYTTKDGGQVLFTAGNAPAANTVIRIYRDTDDSALPATFFSGSAIRSQDLNDDFTQNLYSTQEVKARYLDRQSGEMEAVYVPATSTSVVTKGYMETNYGVIDEVGFTRWRQTASAAQTTFTGAGSYGGVLSYVPTKEQVYLNGALQQRDADYSASNGTSIVFNVALTAGDVVDVVCVNNLTASTVSDAANITYGGQFTGQSTRTVAAKLADVVSVKDFGAVGDGVADDTVAIQACANTGKPFLIPTGTYIISTPIQLAMGQQVFGEASQSAGALTPSTTRIINNQVGGGCFWYTQDTNTGDRNMPSLHYLSLQADYPIRINNETTAILGGVSRNVPYSMRPQVIGCFIKSRIVGTGIGISWSCAYDGLISGCEIRDFSISVLLNGCDICTVRDNRMWQAHAYHILETASGSQGSQNEISHNDILQAGAASCIFIKSGSRHVRIYNNYLEAIQPIAGFIDASTASIPTYAGNAADTQLSTIIRDNRIDGFNYPTSFIYRLDPTTQTHGEIVDVGTVGITASVSNLSLVNSTGVEIDSIKFVRPLSYFRFAGEQFGKWNGYTSNHLYSLSVDGQNLGQFGSDITANGANNYLAASGSNILLLNGFTNYVFLRYPSSTNLFDVSREYSITIVARSAAAETLRVAGLVNNTGQVESSFALTTKFKSYTTTFTSGASASDNNGFLLARTTNNGNTIEIASIVISRLYEQEISRTPTLPQILTVNSPVGTVLVKADGNNTFPAWAAYEFVDGILIQTGASATNSGVIDISMSQSGNAITLDVTGSGSGKHIKVGHLT